MVLHMEPHDYHRLLSCGDISDLGTVNSSGSSFRRLVPRSSISARIKALNGMSVGNKLENEESEFSIEHHMKLPSKRCTECSLVYGDNREP